MPLLKEIKNSESINFCLSTLFRLPSLKSKTLTLFLDKASNLSGYFSNSVLEICFIVF